MTTIATTPLLISCFEFVSDLDISASCFHPTIMQNKPNLLHTQMNVTTALTTAYQNIKPSRRLKNKPNFEPITPTDNSSSFLASHQLHTPFFNPIPNFPSTPLPKSAQSNLFHLQTRHPPGAKMA